MPVTSALISIPLGYHTCCICPFWPSSSSECHHCSVYPSPLDWIFKTFAKPFSLDLLHNCCCFSNPEPSKLKELAGATVNLRNHLRIMRSKCLSSGKGICTLEFVLNYLLQHQRKDATILHWLTFFINSLLDISVRPHPHQCSGVGRVELCKAAVSLNPTCCQTNFRISA